MHTHASRLCGTYVSRKSTPFRTHAARCTVCIQETDASQALTHHKGNAKRIVHMLREGVHGTGEERVGTAPSYLRPRRSLAPAAAATIMVLRLTIEGAAPRE